MAKDTLPLYDRIMGGQLGQMLADWRAEQPRPSYDEIAVRLREHDITVTGETVRRWCIQLGIDATDSTPAAS